MRNVYWTFAGILVSFVLNPLLEESTIYRQSYNWSHVLMYLAAGLFILCFHLTERKKGLILFTFPIFLFCLTPLISTILYNLFKDNTIISFIIGCLACILWGLILFKLAGKVTFTINIKEVNLNVIVPLALIVIFFIFLSIILYTYRTPIINANYIIGEYSHGLLNFNLIINLSSFLLISLLLSLVIPSSLFMTVFREITILSKIKKGFVFLLLIYLFSNLFVLGVELLSGHPISSLIAETGILNLGGQFLGLLLGVALFEEAMFRLFIPVLLVVLFRNYFLRKHAIFLAMIISSLLFSFVHTITGFGGFENYNFAEVIERLIMLFLSGEVFIYLYIRSGNLWLPIITHAFNDYAIPSFLFMNFSNNSFENVIWIMVFTSMFFVQHWNTNSMMNGTVNPYNYTPIDPKGNSGIVK